MNHSDLIQHFYEAFAAGDANGMVQCYHPDICFEDPAFGKLEGPDAGNMWHMLLKRAKGGIKINFSEIQADENSGSCLWVAEYRFGATGRPVINRIQANFVFKDGKIIRHTDQFDLWRWSGQALGWKGLLLGWTPFMKRKIRNSSRKLLSQYTLTLNS